MAGELMDLKANYSRGVMDEKISEYMKWLDKQYSEADKSKNTYISYEYNDGRADAFAQAEGALMRIFNIKEAE